MSMIAEVEVSEPVVIPDTFVTGSCPAHVLGDNVRVTLFVEQRSTMFKDARLERVIVAKVVGSRADMLQIAAEIVSACGQENGLDALAELRAAPIGRH